MSNNNIFTVIIFIMLLGKMFSYNFIIIIIISTGKNISRYRYQVQIMTCVIANFKICLNGIYCRVLKHEKMAKWFNVHRPHGAVNII